MSRSALPDLRDTMLELAVFPDLEVGRRPHGKVLQKAVSERDLYAWNAWRRRHRKERLDLRRIVIRGKYLGGLDLSNCVLDGAELERTDLRSADLRGSSFRRTDLSLSNLGGAQCDGASFHDTNLFAVYAGGCSFTGSTFRGAHLAEANLLQANFTDATFVNTDFERARLDRAVLKGTTIRACNLGHASFVDTRLEDTLIADCAAPYVNAKRIRIGADVEQRELFLGHTIRAVGAGLYSRRITASDLRMASFLGELEMPNCLTHLINAGNDYLVLILGRFSNEGRGVLQALERNVWSCGRIPLVFDFAGPTQRKLVDAVRFFACLSQFIIVDLSNPRSVPFELQAVVPQLAIPLVPVIRRGSEPFAMFSDLTRTYPWVLPVLSYSSARQIDRCFGDLLRLVGEVQAGVALQSAKTARVVPMFRANELLAETDKRDGKRARRKARR
jgi:uncharacterized protein YjbI with pentapeptide repeats